MLQDENTLRFELDRMDARMKVIGVGGGGGNAVNRMISQRVEGVDFITVNTDAQALAGSRSDRRIQLGKKITRGLGAGARPEVGRAALDESADELEDALDGADLVFVTAGMGGGTGTGAAPGIAEMARARGALTVAVVTTPFAFEGKKRMRQAEEGLSRLRDAADAMIVVPNERLLAVVKKNTPLTEAFRVADQVLLEAVRGIADLIRLPGEVNVDFADVRTVLEYRGLARMGEGLGEGSMRAVDAAKAALHSPLLDSPSIAGAAGVLVNITGGTDLTLDEVSLVAEMVQLEAGENAEIIFGAVHDPALEGSLRVTVIATGFEAERDSRSPAATEAAGPAALADRGWERPRPAPAPVPMPGTRTVRPQEEDRDVPAFLRRRQD